MSRVVFAAALVLALSIESSALAWQPIASGNPVWAPPVPYSLNAQGSADLGGFAATEAEVRRAMDDWTLVSCTALTTNYRGSTSARPGSYEGTSTIGWTESGWGHSSSAIGVTGPRWGRNIIEADMDMNGVNFTWTTGSGSFSNVNAYSIILHEGGHYYGLGHTNVRGSSMWPSYGGGIIGLGSDDEAGICALYPGSGTDCTTTGCPSGQECVDGACQTVVGDGTICASCSTSSDCGGASDYCLGYPDGGGYCGRSCGSDADCDGARCVNTSAGPQCVRFAGSSPSCAGATPGCTSDSDCGADQLCSSGSCVPRPTTGSALGEGCTGDDDCQSGLCLAGVCTQSCDWTNPTGSCPASFYCDADSSTSCDVGYCMPGVSGGEELGESCSEDTDCASLHCDGGVCSQACIPGGALGCPAGYACQVGTLPCRGSCRRSGAIGDECELNDDCTSGICAAQGDERSFCTELCTDTTPCPDRFTCTPVGTDVSVCVPDSGGLGEACTNNDECISGICASEGDESYCTRICTDTTPCPGASYDCVATADPSTSVCRPVDGGCGCRTVGGSPASGAPLVLLLGAFGMIVVWRRRRR